MFSLLTLHFLLPLYFDHDAFMYHALHILEPLQKYTYTDIHTDMHTYIHACMLIPYIESWVHSFTHIEHLYSASSRELLRGATDSSTAKKSSLKVRKKTQVTRLYGKSEVQKRADSRSWDPPWKKRGSV